MSRIKVLYVISNRSFRGGEQIFAQVATGLDRSRLAPVMAARPGGPLMERLQAAGVPFYPVELGSRYKVGAIGRLLHIIRREEIDLVHTQSAGGDFFGRIAGYLAGKPVISSMSALVGGGLASPLPLKKRLTVAADRFTERFVSRFTAHSEAVRQELLRSHDLASDRVQTIHNGVDLSRYRPDRTPSGRFRAELGLGPETPLVGGIGHLDWEKGFPYFLQAAAQVIPPAYFVVVGDGPQRAELAAQIESLGLAERCSLVGFRADIRPILADLDLFVLSSVLEGLPMVLLEAMAMSRPVIAAPAGGVAEVVTHGKNGWLVPPANPTALAEGINTLLKERRRAAALAQAGHRHVAQNLTARRMIQRYEALYMALCDQHQHKG